MNLYTVRSDAFIPLYLWLIVFPDVDFCSSIFIGLKLIIKEYCK